MEAGHIYAEWGVMRLRKAGTYTNHPMRLRKQTVSVTSTILDYHVVLRDRTGNHRPKRNQV